MSTPLPTLFFRQDAREVAAFIRPMLEMDPDKRASAQEMLAHPWLQGLEADTDEVSLVKENIPLRGASQIGIKARLARTTTSNFIMQCQLSQYTLVAGPPFYFGVSGFVHGSLSRFERFPLSNDEYSCPTRSGVSRSTAYV